MSDALSAADRSALAAEGGPVHMAVGAVLMFEGTLTRDDLVARVASRLHLVPRWRQRVAHLAPGVTNPVWVDDAGFDVRLHVRSATASSEAELAEIAGHELSRRLDRARPLWELTVVALPDGRTGLVAKLHHALVDGVAALDIGTVLLDPTPEPLAVAELEAAPQDAWAPQSFHRSRHLARLAASPASRGKSLLRESARRALSASVDPVGTAGDAAGELRRGAETALQLARTRPQAPMTVLNEPLGPNRRFAFLRASLADLKAAGRAGGGTVNDAILAAVSGMLGRVLGPLDAAPVALVPVSVRRPGEEGGNRISTVLVDLPAGVEDAASRIAALAAQTRALKDSAAVRAGALLLGASGFAPPLVSSALARAMGGVRAFNLVVSNLPGPQVPLWLDGRRVLAVHPIVPLNPANQRLSVGVLSLDGSVCFGLLADATLDPPVEAFAHALAAEL